MTEVRHCVFFDAHTTCSQSCVLILLNPKCKCLAGFVAHGCSVILPLMMRKRGLIFESAGGVCVQCKPRCLLSYTLYCSALQFNSSKDA